MSKTEQCHCCKSELQAPQNTQPQQQTQKSKEPPAHKHLTSDGQVLMFCPQSEKACFQHWLGDEEKIKEQAYFFEREERMTREFRMRKIERDEHEWIESLPDT